MLLVNADDLGRSKRATDSIVSCYARGRVTSTSAMVFMEDSERAATWGRGADVGLHVNFSEEFSAKGVPEKLRIAHNRVRRFLCASKYALLVFNPLMVQDFETAFAAQLAEFIRLYGRDPSHFDGHQHLHLATNVLLQRLLPSGAKVRRSFSFRPGEKGLPNLWYRKAIDRSLQRRHRVSDYFFSLSDHLAPDRLNRLIDLAQQSTVELMVHPERPAEYAFLTGDTYLEAISRVRLVGYSSL